MNIINQEKLLYHGVRNEPDLLRIFDPKFFENKDLSLLIKVDQKFYDNYKEVPSKKQLLKIIEIKKLEQLTENKLDAVFDIKIDDYQKTWLNENLEAWIKWKYIEHKVYNLVEYFKTIDPEPETINSIDDKIKDIILNDKVVIDYDKGLDFFNFASHEQPVKNTLSTGFSFLDEVLEGGWEKKTLVCIVGQAKKGKSIWLSNIIASASMNGYNSIYISYEMSDRKVMKRIGSNLFNVKMSEYKEFSNNPDMVKEKIKDIRVSNVNMKSLGSIRVKEYPTSSVGVSELESYLVRMEKMQGFKFDIVVVDYINIMRNDKNPNTDNFYGKIKDIAEDLRAIAVRNEWVVITATQLNRDGFDSSDVNVKNIAESAGLLHTIDSMFGIIQDESMKLNNRTILKAMALRDSGGMGDRHEFYIDYDHMRIGEIPPDMVNETNNNNNSINTTNSIEDDILSGL